MSATFRVEGFRELEAELAKLATPATRRASAQRAMIKSVGPIADAARSKAPRRAGHLADNIIIARTASGANAAARQAFGQVLQSGGTRVEAVQAMRDIQRETASITHVYMGPGRHPQAITQEFGTRFHPAQPYMRPAWDAGKYALIPAIGKELWADIQKAVARAERRAARLAARG